MYSTRNFSRSMQAVDNLVVMIQYISMLVRRKATHAIVQNGSYRACIKLFFVQIVRKGIGEEFLSKRSAADPPVSAC